MGNLNYNSYGSGNHGRHKFCQVFRLRRISWRISGLSDITLPREVGVDMRIDSIWNTSVYLGQYIENVSVGP